MNTSSYGVEKATLIRVPATANLMLDSADRNVIYDASGVPNTTAWSFSLNRPQPLTNGFFTRIGTTEVVLEWCLDNVSAALGNEAIGFVDSSGVSHTTTITGGSWNAAEALQKVALSLDALAVPGYLFDVSANNGFVNFANIHPSPRTFAWLPSKLARQLRLNTGSIPTEQDTFWVVDCPDLRPYRYIDFVCEQLTAVQDVKDASTAPASRDVLCRWYFASQDDVPTNYDAFGFPILPGYTKFVTRRLFNPPKQIKWEQNQQVSGYLQFSVYGDDGNIIQETLGLSQYPSNWLMTLQLSEG